MEKKLNEEIKIFGITLKNRIAVSSGTYNYEANKDFYNPKELGLITTKGVSISPWNGNALPRTCEAPSGMLNSIGLENPGIDFYLENELRALKGEQAKVMTNACGHTEEEYLEVLKILKESETDIIELNVSCPNLKCGGLSFGTDTKLLGELVYKAKKILDGRKPLVVKLSPNVTDIKKIAKVCIENGADGLSLINTLMGMRFDLETRMPILANKVGGLSGPAIFPVALRMIYETRCITDIPIIGMGGVSSYNDAKEMLIAGADIISIGTCGLLNPLLPIKILEEEI